MKVQAGRLNETQLPQVSSSLQAHSGHTAGSWRIYEMRVLNPCLSLRKCGQLRTFQETGKGPVMCIFQKQHRLSLEKWQIRERLMILSQWQNKIQQSFVRSQSKSKGKPRCSGSRGSIAQSKGVSVHLTYLQPPPPSSRLCPLIHSSVWTLSSNSRILFFDFIILSVFTS